MDVIDADPQIASEVLAMMARELKAARQRVKDLENVEKSSETIIQKLEMRAETAERLVAKLTGELQSISQKLSDTEHEIMNIRSKIQDKDGEKISAELDARVKDLERALEKYYAKYQAEKIENRTLNTSFGDLQKRTIKLEQDLLAQAEVKSMASTALLKTGAQLKHDIIKYLSSLPKVANRPANNELQSICGRNIDLRALLQLDPNVGSEVAKNFLYLPDRIYWCPGPGLHALGVGPLQTVSPTNMVWTSQRPNFRNLHGRTFHLFYSTENGIHYAGNYKALDLRHMGVEGYADMPVDLALMRGVGVTTICPFVKDTPSTKKTTKLVVDLYRAQAMKGELLGLQCTGFDRRIYEALKEKFINTVGRNEGYFPVDAAVPPVKKRRTE